MATLVICVATFAKVSEAFLWVHHHRLIEAAFRMVPEAGLRASEIDAINASDALDNNENSDADQYKHTMRPSHVPTVTAQAATALFVNHEIELAVLFGNGKNPKLAGIHLGRALHADQDAKHNWASCNAASNGSDSNQACPNGCGPPGLGNHTLSLDCGGRLAMPGYQERTDLLPLSLYDQALDRSVQILRNFVAAVP